MVIIRVWGGIGNQLFQLIFGQYIHYRYNQIVKYDDNSFSSVDKLRKREMDAIAIPLDYDNHVLLSKYKGVPGRLLRFIYKLNPNHKFIGVNDIIPQKFDNNKEYFFQGYWQDYKFFEWLKTNIGDFDIKSHGIPKELKDYEKIISSTNNSVSVHIRRGDYFQPQNIGIYGVCKEDYYKNAIKKIKSLLSDVRFFVFSDDLEWVSKHLVFDADTVFIPNYDINQFAYIELMSHCKHHIISNSSFSWWGAVLNEQLQSIVICPSKWTLNSFETIALKQWIKIPV